MTVYEELRPATLGHANYRGDVTSIVGRVKGPTTWGEMVTAVTAEYRPEGDRTVVGFDFARDAEVQQERATAVTVPAWARRAR